MMKKRQVARTVCGNLHVLGEQKACLFFESHKIMSTRINKGMFTSNSDEWETPLILFYELDKEFDFDLDPCATDANAKCTHYYTKEDDGLLEEWGWGESEEMRRVFMNPPYGREIGKWIKKAYEESRKGCTVVCLLPARTDTKWFHDYCTKGEIRFIKGRLKFSGMKNSAPFPSMIVIFKGEYNDKDKRID